MDQQDHLDRIELGRAAQAVAAEVIDTLQEQEQKIISRLIGMYRAKNFDHAQYVGCIGEIVALQDLIKGLEYTVHQGNVSAQKEFGDA